MATCNLYSVIVLGTTSVLRPCAVPIVRCGGSLVERCWRWDWYLSFRQFAKFFGSECSTLCRWDGASQARFLVSRGTNWGSGEDHIGFRKKKGADQNAGTPIKVQPMFSLIL